MTEYNQMISVRISKPMHRHLLALAEHEQSSVSQLIRTAVAAYLRDKELVQLQGSNLRVPLQVGRASSTLAKEIIIGE